MFNFDLNSNDGESKVSPKLQPLSVQTVVIDPSSIKIGDASGTPFIGYHIVSSDEYDEITQPDWVGNFAKKRKRVDSTKGFFINPERGWNETIFTLAQIATSVGKLKEFKTLLEGYDKNTTAEDLAVDLKNFMESELSDSPFLAILGCEAVEADDGRHYYQSTFTPRRKGYLVASVDDPEGLKNGLSTRISSELNWNNQVVKHNYEGILIEGMENPRYGTSMFKDSRINFDNHPQFLTDLGFTKLYLSSMRGETQAKNQTGDVEEENEEQLDTDRKF